MKLKFVTTAACLALVASPTYANDDFIGGLMGAMIGAAISNQGNTKRKFHVFVVELSD